MSKKVLHFRLDAPQYSSEFMRRGFIEAGYEYHGINWQQVKFDEGILGFQARAIQAANEIQPDLIFIHIQSPGVLDIETCQELSTIGFTCLYTFDVRDDVAWMKELEPYLNMILVADGETVKEFPIDKSFVLQSSCDMGMYYSINHCNVDELSFDEFKKEFGKILSKEGLNEVSLLNQKARNASTIQVGRLSEKIYTKDICFIGSNYVNTNLNFPLAEERFNMVTELKKEYGDRFLYKGMNWSTSEYVSPAKELEIYNTSKIAICHNNFYREGYSSDRIWRILACGCFSLTKYFPGIEGMFEVGKHLDWWRTIDELKLKINYYISNDEARARIADAGHRHFLMNHTWMDRVIELEQLIKKSKSETYGAAAGNTMP